MSEVFTPRTEQVRSHYVFNQGDIWDGERGVAFDRWIAEVRADARDEGQKSVDHDSFSLGFAPNPYRKETT